MSLQTKKAGTEEAPQFHRIRITLTSRNVKNLEKGMFFKSPPFMWEVFVKKYAFVSKM